MIPKQGANLMQQMQSVVFIRYSTSIDSATFVPVITKRLWYGSAVFIIEKPRALEFSQDDQRSWNKIAFFVKKENALKDGDVIQYNSINYKIVDQEPRLINNMIKYSVVEDFLPVSQQIDDPVGVCLCNVINNWFNVNNQPLQPNSLMLFNSNYTPEPSQSGLLIVVRNLSEKTIGNEDTIVSDEETTPTLYEQAKTAQSTDYSISLISRDGSAYNNRYFIVNSMLSDYAVNQMLTVGCNIGSQPDIINVSDVSGGSMINRFEIRVKVIFIQGQQIATTNTLEDIDVSLVAQSDDTEV